MNIAPGSILNMAPAGHDWVVAFDHGHEGGEDLVCPVIGWATVVDSHLTDGTATTSIQPAFLHVGMVWTPAELREHDHEVGVWNISVREITHA
jgi:hypothetical protein